MFLKKRDYLEKSLCVLITLLIIYSIYSLYNFFVVAINFILSVLSPFIIAAILYYTLRPIVRFLEKKIHKILAIAITFIILISIIAFISFYIYPIIENQISTFLHTINTTIKEKSNQKQTFWNVYVQNIDSYIHTVINELYHGLFNNLSIYFHLATQFIISLCVVPFILFLFLQEDKKIYKRFLQNIPNHYKSNLKSLINELDLTLTRFINGRVLLSLIISSVLFVIFLIIGLDYPFVLYLSSFIFFIIPSVGSFIAFILPLIVAFSMSTFMGLEILLIMSVAVVVEGFYLSPKIMGKNLFVHPLTVLLILLVAGTLFGIIGLIICTPLYVVGKILLRHFLILLKQYKSVS